MHRDGYKNFILKTLLKAPGYSMEVWEMIRKFEQLFMTGEGNIFIQREEIETDWGSEQRWKNALKWARKDLVLTGFLEKGSQHGVWELTGFGKQVAENLPRNLHFLYGQDATRTMVAITALIQVLRQIPNEAIRIEMARSLEVIL